jgi:hypothetical protein
MNAEEFLEHAAGLVTRRRRQYGAPIDLFDLVALRWSQVLGTKLTREQVIVCLVDLKVARLAHHSEHRDSLVDLIGTAWSCTNRCAMRQPQRDLLKLLNLLNINGSPGIGSAEPLLKPAEVRKIGG